MLACRDGTSCNVYVVRVQAFMFESCLSMRVTKWAEEEVGNLDKTYYKCWDGLVSHFDPKWKP